jgi:hypothetical protein
VVGRKTHKVLTAGTVSNIYDEHDYLPKILNDSLSAYGTLLLHVPYVTQQGLSRWIPIISILTKRGVTVIVILQSPRGWNTRHRTDLEPDIRARLEQFEALINWLRSTGASVQLRERIHAKFVIIDDRILWEGSLNFLSHFDTREHVRRSVNRKEVREVKRRHDLNEASNGTINDAQLRETIATRREAFGYNKTGLADCASVARSDISRLEKGESKLFSDVLIKVLDALDLRVMLVPSHLYEQVDAFVKKGDVPISN